MEQTISYHYRVIERLQEQAASHGMKVTTSKYSLDHLALTPLENLLPIYTRDAQLCEGSAEHLLAVLQGWSLATTYYSHIDLVSLEKIKEAEDIYNQTRTIHKIITNKLLSI